MKQKLRTSLTVALTSGLLLAATACAPTPGATEPQAQNGSQDAPAVQQPVFPKGGEKHITFESPLRTIQGFPEAWKGGDGWAQAGVTNLVALPNHIGYTHLNQQTRETGFKLFNDKGESVADIGTPEEIKSGLFGVVLDGVYTAWQDDKMFTVYIQTGADAQGMGIVVLTTFDENANQISRKVAHPQYKSFDIGTDDGAIVIEGLDHKDDDRFLNLKTGELEVIPEAPDGENWGGMVNGVHIYQGDKSIKSGDWTLPYSDFEPLGKYISVNRLDETGSTTGVCDIIDPKTGKTVEGNDGGCAKAWSRYNGDDEPASPTNGFILYKTVINKANQVISPDKVLFRPSGKSYTFTGTSGITDVTSVDQDGTYYAAGDKTVYTLSQNNNFAPELAEGATAAPLVVSGNGIAAFNEEGKWSAEGTISFVLPKK